MPEPAWEGGPVGEALLLLLLHIVGPAGGTPLVVEGPPRRLAMGHCRGGVIPNLHTPATPSASSNRPRDMAMPRRGVGDAEDPSPPPLSLPPPLPFSLRTVLNRLRGHFQKRGHEGNRWWHCLTFRGQTIKSPPTKTAPQNERGGNSGMDFCGWEILAMPLGVKGIGPVRDPEQVT